MIVYLFVGIAVVLFAIIFFCCSIIQIREDVEAMRTLYLDMLKAEVCQVNDCFDKWQATLDALDSSIKLTNLALDARKGDREE